MNPEFLHNIHHCHRIMAHQVQVIKHQKVQLDAIKAAVDTMLGQVGDHTTPEQDAMMMIRMTHEIMTAMGYVCPIPDELLDITDWLKGGVM